MELATILGLAITVAAVGVTWPVLRRLAGAGGASAVAAVSLLAFAIERHPSIPLTIAAVALSLRWRHPNLRLRRWDLPLRVVLPMAGWSVYEALRFAGEGSAPTALANGRAVVRFERALDLFVEPTWQEALTSASWATRAWNVAYGHWFLPVVVGALLWYAVADHRRYRLLVTGLGVSAALCVATFILFPVAPPRLVAEAGVVDTVVASGARHHFANEYAAIPSLHVGWIALVAVVATSGLRSRWRLPAAILPPCVMTLVVVATGNHYLVDGVVGSAYALAPLALISSGPRLRSLASRLRGPLRRAAPAGAPGSAARAWFAMLTLGPLLAYLLIRRPLEPGFTDFWGYLVLQLAVTIGLLLAGEVVFGRFGGLSWETHVLAVVCSYADTLGTDGDLYRDFAQYDKLTHFLGVAAITFAAHDCSLALARRNRWRTPCARLALAAVAIGLSVGLAWEVYEWAGDAVLSTRRVQGRADTSWDLVADVAGAASVALVAWLRSLARPAAAPARSPWPRTPWLP